jgi:hypothetical protein
MKAVVIPGQEGRFVGTGEDIAAVVAAVGDRSELRWLLFAADISHVNGLTPLWPAVPKVEEWSRRPGGFPVTWQQILDLSATTAQFIWGAFIGYREDGSAALLLEILDSGSWIIWADDKQVIDRVRASFVGVKKCRQRRVWAGEGWSYPKRLPDGVK